MNENELLTIHKYNFTNACCVTFGWQTVNVLMFGWINQLTHQERMCEKVEPCAT